MLDIRFYLGFGGADIVGYALLLSIWLYDYSWICTFTSGFG